MHRKPRAIGAFFFVAIAACDHPSLRLQQLPGASEQPDYSDVALANAERWIRAQEEGWEQMFAELGIAPLTLWYEDAIADPDGMVRAVADYLGVALEPGAEVQVPEIRRQDQAGAEAWATRHAQGG